MPVCYCYIFDSAIILTIFITKDVSTSNTASTETDLHRGIKKSLSLEDDEQACLSETVERPRENENNPTKGGDSSDPREPSSCGPTGVSF